MLGFLLGEALRDLRKVADENGAVLIGETWTKDVSELKDYYGEHNNELQMPMDLMMTGFTKLSAQPRTTGLFISSSACGAIVVVPRCSTPCSASGPSNSTIVGFSWLRLTKK